MITCSLQKVPVYESQTGFVSGKRNSMTLKSVREDVQTRTLSAISGLLGKLYYLVGLRKDDGAYSHWGLARVHGDEAAQRALGEAHKATLSAVLRTPLSQLETDLLESSKAIDIPQEKFVGELNEKEQLLLPDKPGAGSRRHLSSVLLALSALLKRPR